MIIEFIQLFQENLKLIDAGDNKISKLDYIKHTQLEDLWVWFVGNYQSLSDQQLSVGPGRRSDPLSSDGVLLTLSNLFLEKGP